MDSKELRELIKLISNSDFAKFEMEREGFKLKLVRGTPEAVPVAIPAQALPPPSPAERALEAGAEAAPAPAADDSLVELTSPIVGTFYTSSSPEAPPLVEVGAQVTKGQVVCIIEAMKVMNEIEAESDGELTQILVANGQPVEYGEVLFRLRPPGS